MTLHNRSGRLQQLVVHEYTTLLCGVMKGTTDIMRVIAGAVRGMRLNVPGGTTTRPTSDRVKEALFSILDSNNLLAGAQVLDLCAGSGSLGIEALSRGAAHTVFVEKDRTTLQVLRTNLARTGFPAHQYEVLAIDCQQALKLLIRRQKMFSLVLFDPPYQSDLYQIVIAKVGSGLLMAEGMLVAETAARVSLPERLPPCIRTDRRLYGDTALDFFMLEPHYAP